MRLQLVVAFALGVVGACTQRPFAGRETVCRDYCALFTDLDCGLDDPAMFDHCHERCMTPPIMYPCREPSHALVRCLSTVSCSAFRDARTDRSGPCGAEVRALSECDRRIEGPK